MIFGAIADDYTGASDLAGMLAERGVRTVQTLGLPNAETAAAIGGRFDAVVIALKSRSIAPEDAVEQSLQALAILQRLGVEQIQFKYCSTFDSTERGNIGPVTAALLEVTGEAFTVAVPALPINGRTQYNGCLFVNGELISQSPMRDHPLNPMREPNLVRHLQAQTNKTVGLVDWAAVRRGKKSITNSFERLQAEGVSIALVDVLQDDDLRNIAEACADMPLITGGSGLAMQLPHVWRSQGRLPLDANRTKPARSGPGGTLMLSGSCSAATLQQVEQAREQGIPIIAVDTMQLLESDAEIDRLELAARRAINSHGAALVASSAPPAVRAATAAATGAGPETIRLAIERCFGELARRLVGPEGVRRLIVAGGETAGAAVEALEVEAVEVLDTIDPGVPAMRTIGKQAITLALKSGNFGSRDFFAKARGILETT